MSLYDLYYGFAALRVAHNMTRARAWRPSHLAAIARRPRRVDPDAALDACLTWLGRAQDAVRGGGVSAGYSLRNGWDGPYPETTGYIVNTFLDHGGEWRQRATKAADWLLAIQNADGSFPGGVLRKVAAPPVVFNTGQILQGLVGVYEATKEPRYLEAAERAGDWLANAQDDDGAWRRHEYNSTPHAYQARVAWPMASLAVITRNERHKLAAERGTLWSMQRARENGWFEQSAFRPQDVPFTHTIAYTQEGLLEAGALLDRKDVVDVVRKSAWEVLRRYEGRRAWRQAPPDLLPGRMDEHWKSRDSFSCITGCAQTSIVWFRLAEIDRDLRFTNAALRLMDAVVGTIDLDPATDPAIRGAVPGSYPHAGAYMAFTYPNWAAKFVADALLLRRRALAELEGGVAR